MIGETIAPNSEETVFCQLKIPENIVHTLHNCEILSVNYYIKVCNNLVLTFYHGGKVIVDTYFISHDRNH